ncbi:THAP domain-containing protein 4 [Quaeritorhiza haematococci]|nr:THAP domain-containing protein 4 [Quaeritorhiza haematococci]
MADSASDASSTPSVGPLGFLVGTWKGEGQGVYPTIRDFRYGEQIKIWGVPGKPIYFYTQITSDPEKENKPMHAESGFFRALPAAGGKIELILSQPNGLASVEEGIIFADNTIALKSTQLARSSSARPPHVTEYTRVMTVDPKPSPPTLKYEMHMATTTTPQLTLHLSAELTRIGDAP